MPPLDYDHLGRSVMDMMLYSVWCLLFRVYVCRDAELVGRKLISMRPGGEFLVVHDVESVTIEGMESHPSTVCSMVDLQYATYNMQYHSIYPNLVPLLF